MVYDHFTSVQMVKSMWFSQWQCIPRGFSVFWSRRTVMGQATDTSDRQLFGMS